MPSVFFNRPRFFKPSRREILRNFDGARALILAGNQWRRFARFAPRLAFIAGCCAYAERSALETAKAAKRSIVRGSGELEDELNANKGA